MSTEEGVAQPGGMKIPSPDQQKEVITSLGREEESTHVYCVSKAWYATWKTYVGLSDAAKPQKPGSLVMDIQDEEANMYIDEKIWVCWVAWYGVHATHQLDRRNCASDEKDFEVCILSPYSGIVANPVMTFDISEETGYIEVQLNKIFQVSVWRQSRLWACEKTRNSRFQLLLDRTHDLCFQDVIDPGKSYILGLEVAHPDGTWPSQVAGQPKGSLDKYSSVTGRKSIGGKEYWEGELTSTLETVLSGVSAELHDTVSGVVDTVKCINTQQEKDTAQIREALESERNAVKTAQRSVDDKVRHLVKEEDTLKQEEKRLHKERAALERDTQTFKQEITKMNALNKITESRIKLNIGGHVYMTSTLTLCRENESMLAAMFSGRHSLKQDPDGSYFIDRDGTHFRYILNYLRDGGFRDGTLPADTAILTELITEAEYYGLNALVNLLQSLLEPSKSTSSKNVYSKVSKRKVPLQSKTSGQQ